MDSPQYHIAQTIADRFSQLPQVESVAVAGSVATGRANASSDVDIYIYPTTDLTREERLAIGREFSATVQAIDYWGASLTWVDRDTNIEVETMFFTASWMEGMVLQAVEAHQAQMGFTTSFWHTIKVSKILFDRNGWLVRLQEKARQPYPPQLVQAIVDLNYPLLRDIYYSYRYQTLSAVRRKDVVVINYKVGAFLASYFDILFAVNRMPHPGEKRMLDIIEHDCDKRPPNLRDNVTKLLSSAGSGAESTIETLDTLVDDLSVLLRSEGLLR